MVWPAPTHIVITVHLNENRSELLTFNYSADLSERIA